MSTLRLPVELLDRIVDNLHGAERALSNCCLISKSWIPRARKHLFADVRFVTEEDLELWKEMFPDPSTSPARYTKYLLVHCLHVVTVADADVDGWIRGFSRAVHLTLGSYNRRAVSLLPFHGFSPAIKSLYVGFDSHPSSQIAGLILSFPLLEDLAVNSSHLVGDHSDGSRGLPTIVQPSNPPKLTGTLELVTRNAGPVIRPLLSLPGGFHFRKLTLTWCFGTNVSRTTAFMEKCAHTLESLDITGDPRASIPTSASVLITYFRRFQPAQPRSISRRQRSSEMWFFGPGHHISGGSLRRFEPPCPTIESSGRSRLFLTFRPPMSTPSRDAQLIGTGWILIVSSSNSWSPVRPARRLNARLGERMRET